MFDAKPTDAIALLEADHRAVDALFERFESMTDDDEKSGLVKTICTELIIHTSIEEEIFYPALKGKIDDDMLDEAYVEHDGAKMLIAELIASTPSAPFYDAKVKVLSEEIKHHVKEEEEPGDGMFAAARETDVDLVALGEHMQVLKDELKAKYESAGPPTPTARSLNGARLELGQPVDGVEVA